MIKQTSYWIPTVVSFCRQKFGREVFDLKQFYTGHCVCLLADVSNFVPDMPPNLSHRTQRPPYMRSSAIRNPSLEILPRCRPKHYLH